MSKAVKITTEEASKRLGNVPESKIFWTNDGRQLRNIMDLREALATMDEGIYYHHTGQGRNDFFNWVRDVVSDTKLASDLNRAKSRAEACDVVSERIAFLRRKM